MKAAVLPGLHRPLTIERVSDPEPQAGDVIVRVGRCGICGSDLHMSEDPAFGATPGTIFGHEFAGEIVEVGPDVQGLKAGDLVSVIPLYGCGQCPSCIKGEIAWCDQFGLQGGGYAEFARASARQCVKLPKTASLADGAIVEPLAVALHGVNLSGITAGDHVVIIGAGPIGLAVAFWARRAGAAKVVVQDIAPFHGDRALAMGATHFTTDPAAPECQNADIVFECVGVPGLIDQAVGQVKNRGTILLLGLCTRPDTFNSFAMLSKEIRLITSAFFTSGEFEAALEALDVGAAEPRLLITETIALDAVPEVFEALKKRTHQCKVLIAP